MNAVVVPQMGFSTSAGAEIMGPEASTFDSQVGLPICDCLAISITDMKRQTEHFG